MQKWIAILAGVGIAAAAGARGAQPSADRTTSIWAQAQERLERQNDEWFKLGDFPRVIESLRFQASLFPTDYDIVTNLGWMLENVEDRASALAIYIKYRESNPEDPDSYFPEADYYYRKKAFDKVPGLLETSLKVGHGPQPNAYRILAHAYEKLNLFADAARVWKQYLVRQPEDGPAKVNLARVEKKLRGTSN
jgi:tetratricopeptide (TPR) repeat protein